MYINLKKRKNFCLQTFMMKGKFGEPTGGVKRMMKSIFGEFLCGVRRMLRAEADYPFGTIGTVPIAY